MRHLRIAPNWLRYFIVVVLVLGVFFRCVNLDIKVFSHDETYTMLRLSGYTKDEVKQRLFNGQIISPDNLFRYQNINNERDWSDTIRSLAVEDPQHPPLYYIVARFWVQIFGQIFVNSVTAIRSLSVLMSLLAITAMYWLCWELFKVPLGVCWIAIAILSSSPLHFLYAQEASEYMLWAVTILVSSASLLRAIRLDSKYQYVESPVFNWGLYSLTLALSLYTFLLSGFVVIAHVIYVTTINKFRWNKAVETFTVASLVSFLFFSPWIVILINNFDPLKGRNTGNYTALKLVDLIQSWLLQGKSIFFDIDGNLDNIFDYFLGIFFCALVVYSLYFLYLTTNIKTWLFMITLIVIPGFPLVWTSLLSGATASTSARDFIPSVLGIQIAVAYLCIYNLNNGILARRQAWQIIVTFVMSMGLISIAVSSETKTWWNKSVSYGNPEISQMINQAAAPLLISDDSGVNYGNIFSLSYLLDTNVRIQLIQKDMSLSTIVRRNSTVFILNPSNDLREEVEVKYRLRSHPVYVDKYSSLLKLSR
ncbi:hypothetical protein NIES4101_75850 [Calothrix sp. NIES-4101]|nr:hypothetical protein NIES4101_75850 [Calothrix sp. NIES-4101]